MVTAILVIGFSILSFTVGHEMGWDHGFFKGWMKGLDMGLDVDDAPILDLTGNN
ncbi:MAG TPA: hypothetical protein VGN15_05920 [Ktedonobacteraceae bacterium]|nr:hypothetical protein [Ktedonobacteraceae bacterium]